MFDPDSLQPAAEGEIQVELFKGTQVRKAFQDGMWYFSIVDVIEVLTDSPEPSSYWTKMKTRDDQLRPNWTKLKLPGADGKKYATECATPEELLRIIQSVPSEKAEPIKRWLAHVGFERIEEDQNPELTYQRLTFNYKAAGRDDEWIANRFRSFDVRKLLTDEMQARGVNHPEHFRDITAIIAKGTMGITPKEHKQKKGLGKNHALRDNMTSLELIFTMLGEATTKEIAETRDTQGYLENKDAARIGGSIAGDARERLELETGKPVVSGQNFLTPRQKKNVLLSKVKGFKELPIPPGDDA